MKVGIVIPCWRDREAAAGVAAGLAGCPGVADIVIADCAGADGLDWAPSGVRVVACPAPGRGPQMNAGAAACGGEVLLFNHADTRLTCDHVAAVRDGLRRPAVGGAFHRAMSRHHPRLGWAEPLVRRWQTRFGILYGDQSVFVWRDVFESLGGFAEIPLMEDVDFSDRLRREGPVVVLDPPVETSMRRFRGLGYARTKLQNLAFVWLFRQRLVAPARLHQWYYRIDGRGTAPGHDSNQARIR